MTTEYMGVQVDYSRDSYFDELGLKRMKESYMREEETSPQQRFAYVSKQFGTDEAHAQRLYDYASWHWLSYSTPILSFGRSKKGLPISCFLNWIEDTAEGLVENYAETSWLSMLGGGVGIGFGIRHAGEKSTGIMPHLKTYDASSLAYKQGTTRRGSYAAYLDIDHPDILTFLEMRKPTGDPNQRALNLHHGINISNAFMEKIQDCMMGTGDDAWPLIDPQTYQVVETVSAKELWQRILETRMQTGEPYLHFIDTSNEALPSWLKDKGLRVRQSNLCSEIVLPTSNERTAVCCLSSVNLEYFDDWKNHPTFLADIAEMLDNVLQYFIDNAPDTVARAKFSAMQERSIGVGALGFHAYLQKNMIPFESAMASGRNRKMFEHIRKGLDDANEALADKRGACPDAAQSGVKKRFSHVMAIAPNATSSIIMGNTSPSIEPFRANAYRQDTLSGSFLNKNRHLDALIQKKCEEITDIDPDDLWSSIIAHEGSIQHLGVFSDWEKDVFKTAMEIDQRWVVQHAADRQQFIDQAQSVNLFFRPDVNIKYLHMVHYMAWAQKLKSLYYCRSEKIGKADKVSKAIERKAIEETKMEDLVNGETCLACEG